MIVLWLIFICIFYDNGSSEVVDEGSEKSVGFVHDIAFEHGRIELIHLRIRIILLHKLLKSLNPINQPTPNSNIRLHQHVSQNPPLKFHRRFLYNKYQVQIYAESNAVGWQLFPISAALLIFRPFFALFVRR